MVHKQQFQEALYGTACGQALFTTLLCAIRFPSQIGGLFTLGGIQISKSSHRATTVIQKSVDCLLITVTAT